MAQAHLSFLIVAVFASTITAMHLPYEVLDTIVELSDIDDHKDLNRVNVSDDRGPTRPIYRLDLDPEYIAYYEIDTGSEYIVLSSGRKTGDFREVESGPDPRPTDVVLQQAQENGQQCAKFYRLSPIGLIICKNDKGTVVAASYNWTADVAEIEDWRKLDQMVREDVDIFKRLWKERATERRTKSDWASTEVLSGVGKLHRKEIDEEMLTAGSVVSVAIGEYVQSVDVYITNGGNSPIPLNTRSRWQQKLCKVLVHVCQQNGSTKVNPSAIKKTPNNLIYLQLRVHGNNTFVGNTLQWREIGFIIEIKGRQKEMVRKYFAINLHSQRFRRSTSSEPCEKAIPRESDFPDYDQHKCCGCVSGCSPVAWAQVFGYYDRLASSFSYSPFSRLIYGDMYTTAPMTLDKVKKDPTTMKVKAFVEDIRSEVETFCKNGEGLTTNSKMHLIAPWFRARQGYMARIVSYLEKSKKRSVSDARVEYGSRSWIQSKGVEWLNEGYPVVFGFPVEGGGHSAVATKCWKKVRRYRHCISRQNGWRRGSVCSWRNAYDYEFFLHYGWGRSNNGRKTINPWDAHVAYLGDEHFSFLPM